MSEQTRQNTGGTAADAYAEFAGLVTAAGKDSARRKIAGKALERLIFLLGYEHMSFAHALHTDVQTVRRWINGLCIPRQVNMRNLEKLALDGPAATPKADYLGVPVRHADLESLRAASEELQKLGICLTVRQVLDYLLRPPPD